MGDEMYLDKHDFYCSRKYPRKYLSNQNIFMCCLHRHLETSVHKHLLTNHKINLSIHVIWPFKDDSSQFWPHLLLSCLMSALCFLSKWKLLSLLLCRTQSSWANAQIKARCLHQLQDLIASAAIVGRDRQHVHTHNGFLRHFNILATAVHCRNVVQAAFMWY